MREIVNPYGFIYITTNLINGKRYIGQKMFREKWKGYLGSGIHLKRAIKKYGRENFVRNIVDIAYSKEDLDRLEKEWINNYNAIENDDFYNIAEGGEGGFLIAGKSELEIKRIYKKIGDSNKGIKHSKQAREKISKGHMGIEPWNKGISGYSVHSEETKSIMSVRQMGENNSFYGRKHSAETKKKFSESRSGKNNPRAKRVICITTGKVFDTIKDGAIYYNIRGKTSISSCCNGRLKSAGKHPITGKKLIWEYLEDSE